MGLRPTNSDENQKGAGNPARCHSVPGTTSDINCGAGPRPAAASQAARSDADFSDDGGATGPAQAEGLPHYSPLCGIGNPARPAAWKGGCGQNWPPPNFNDLQMGFRLCAGPPGPALRATGRPTWTSAAGLESCPTSMLLAIRRFQGGDIELLHLEHGPYHTLPSGGVLILDHVEENGRHDLPAKPVFVFQPAALDFVAAR